MSYDCAVTRVVDSLKYPIGLARSIEHLILAIARWPVSHLVFAKGISATTGAHDRTVAAAPRGRGFIWHRLSARC
jgi:hypothetical protein